MLRSGARPGPSFAGAGGEPRVAGGHSPVVPVRLPRGGRRRRLSLGTGLLGLLTAPWVRAELDNHAFEPGGLSMILGMSVGAFTILHLIITLVAIGSGLIVVGGMFASNRLPVTTAVP